jgi:hypothetical protein
MRLWIIHASFPLCGHASGGRVMIWGCLTWAGLGSGTLCSDHMKSADYLDILGNHVHPSMD